MGMDMESVTKSTLTIPEIRDKIYGTIYGAAIGDGLGLATEFMRKEQAKLLYGNGPIKFGLAEGHEFWRDACRNGWFDNDFTDDTDQLLLIAQCLLADNGTLNPIHLAYRIKEWCRIGFPELKDKLPCGIGFTVGSTCSHKDVLSDPLRAAYDIWNKNERNLAANGALMRTSVVGAPFFWDERKVVENAMIAAKVTHADPRSVTSAVIVSVVISRLLRGLKANEHKDELLEKDCATDRKYFTEFIQMGSNENGLYLEKFANFPTPSPKPLVSSIQSRVLRQIRRAAAYLTNQPLNPLFEADFQIPQHAPVDIHRFENPAPIRPNVKPMDEFGADEEMMKLCREVVDRYKFLVENHSLCPSEEDVEHTADKELSKPKWVDELYQHCFPESLSSLKLDERNKIGYTFKCLGAGLYLGTRKKPEEMTSSEFFEHLITELVLETGDADTNCTVAGAVLGCRLGMSGLPQKWVHGLRHKDFLDKISNDLCTMVEESMSAQTD